MTDRIPPIPDPIDLPNEPIVFPGEDVTPPEDDQDVTIDAGVEKVVTTEDLLGLPNEDPSDSS